MTAPSASYFQTIQQPRTQCGVAECTETSECRRSEFQIGLVASQVVNETAASPLHSSSSFRAAQQLALDLQVDLYSSGTTTTLQRLENSLRELSAFLHPHHGLVMTLKRSLMLCYSQAKQGTLGRKELERMKTIAMVCTYT